MSAFLDLAAAARTAMLASPALAGGHVYVGRDRPMPTDRTQQIDVQLISSRGRAATLDGTFSRWDTAIGLTLRVRANAAQDGDTAVDGLLADVFARMAAATPPAGAGRWTLQPDVQWSVDEADRTLCEAQLVLRIEHFTGASSLAAAA